MKYKTGDYVLTRERKHSWIYTSKIIDIKENKYLVRDLWAVRPDLPKSLQEEHDSGTSVLHEDEVIEKILKDFVLADLQITHPELYL